jgi:hypothetical protein
MRACSGERRGRTPDAHHVLIQRIAAGHQHAQAGPVAPPGPPEPLPGGGDGARIAVQHRHVQRADVHAQLQRRGADHAVDAPGTQRPLAAAPLARQIAAAIGQHPRRAARVAVEDVLQILGDHLHHQPRAGEDDVLEPGRVAARAMRVVCERAEARMPRSGSITGGFHSSRCRSPRGAPLSVTAATGSPISRRPAPPGWRWWRTRR